MSIDNCTVCGDHIDTDNDLFCYIDDECLCKRHRCETCDERRVESGFDQCRQCLVASVEADPKELECFLDQSEILRWIAEANHTPELRRRQAS